MSGDGRKDTQVISARPQTETSKEKKSVLLVDDEPSVLRALERVLRSKGFDVTAVSSGAQAIQTIVSQPHDVIVTDITMPGASGVELLQVVRAYDLDVPVILMTGMPTVETAMQAVEMGAMQYLTKPVPTGDLVRSIERATRLHDIARAKRNALKLHGGDDQRPGDHAGLSSAFDRALSTMWMAFQPIVDTHRKRVFAYEALMRSKEPALPHPGAVLDAAEKLGRIHDLGRHIRALSAHGFAEAPADVLLFVNLHTHELLDDAIYDARAPLTQIANRVVLEITERSTLDDVRDVQRRVNDLRHLGYKLAVDDLGAGYAGLSSFVALEPEFVKLDMSLVRGVHTSLVRQRLIGTMTSLCTDLDMKVIAEGVEEAAERDGVRQLGCELLQGYFFAKPGPPFPSVAFPEST